MATTTAASALDELADRYWEAWLSAHPIAATALGDRRFDARLPPIGRDADRARATELRGLANELDGLRPHVAGEADRLTGAALEHAISTELDQIAADQRAFTVDPLDGPQVEFLNLPAFQPAGNPDERAAMVERWRAMGPWIDALVAEHRRGAADGRPPVGALVDRVIDEIDELLDRPDHDWPLARPADGSGQEEFADALGRAVAESVRPSLARYRRVLEEQLRPLARDDAHPGLVHLPGGPDVYNRLARGYTTIATAPEELHEIGLREIERLDAELSDLGGRLLGTTELPAILERLRADPELHFRTRDEVFETARRSLERATAATADWFGRLPSTPCDVVRMEPHEEKHSTIAYYREPAGDGSRPGQYYVNTSEPETRPRYEAEALAFHESVPGHHFQIALAQELDHLPAFRRYEGSTAFIEGWGLYTERLGDEMGLYSGDVDRFGILSFDAWRASRLVVDTGMHALGWSRSRAIAFMTEHTALGPNNIANEVDRYIAWPGQALAYKVGQLELLRLREESRRRLGAAFDIRRFHDVVLGEGALPLGVLAEMVGRRLTRDAAR
jgi:uncharacterized protein (DUF885 family)